MNYATKVKIEQVKQHMEYNGRVVHVYLSEYIDKKAFLDAMKDFNVYVSPTNIAVIETLGVKRCM